MGNTLSYVLFDWSGLTVALELVQKGGCNTAYYWGGAEGISCWLLIVVRTKCLDPQIYKIILHLDNGLLRCDAM